MTTYLLSSLARSMHSMTTEAKLKFLPDLLKIKEDAPDSEEVLATLYIPQKEARQTLSDGTDDSTTPPPAEESSQDDEPL